MLGDSERDRERDQKSLAGRAGSPVCAYGEMVDLLWKGGNPAGAIKLEELWNELASSYDFSLLCAYNMGNFGNASDAEQFATICKQHTHVIPTERYVQGDAEARLVEISLLQQRARALETELAHRDALERNLRETVAALQERELELRDVLENAAEGIHRVGPDGIIQWANNSELELLGYRAEEYIGRHIAGVPRGPGCHRRLARATLVRPGRSLLSRTAAAQGRIDSPCARQFERAVRGRKVCAHALFHA